MIRHAAFALLMAGASPAMAQDHSMHGMHMPAAAPTATASPPAPDGSAATRSEAGEEPRGTDQPPGSAEAPPVTHDIAAARYFGADAMARAHQAMMEGHGGGTYSQVRFDLAEVQVRQGREGYRWEGLAWIGGDVDRLALRSEGEGRYGGGIEHAEVQVLYRRALDAWWNLEAGVRQDLQPGPRRTHAAVAIEGLARYMWDVRAQAYLSTRGELTGRIEATVDQRLTNRLILRPRVELALSAQDMPDLRTGPGVTEVGLGLRLHALIRPELMPYVGWSWTHKTGRTGRYATAAGEPRAEGAAVIGLATWF
ncbi:copper resistance protein B [Novosphingobium cyanobacteriorum]|uniref:Copper resistance protein B n=1 Tax=Novosphingobium cyanobacteriorum TaxID=3024215 RepID=A0ABT6CDT0_9SPHN|nr:copper resistance protein B [Novosphingobium cyanobacteriorum]MDF8332076.1 copper resistance protein B [Novosphingobium cyanobacteriorum]